MNFDLVKELSEAFGVAGRENEVRDIICREVEEYCDNIRTDALGNLMTEKHGDNKSGGKLLLIAPMDEPGFIVNGIREGGGTFLSFSAVGRIRPVSVVSEAVVVGDGRVPGVISLKAVHISTKEEREKPVPLKSLFIDIGADTKESAEKLVTVGDYAAFMSRPRMLGGGLFCNKAAGRSVLCAALIKVLRSDLAEDLTCVFTAQSGAGMRGARADFGIDEGAYDAAVTLGCIEDKSLKLGEGAVLPMMINETMPDMSVANILRNIDGVKAFGHKSEDGDITAINIKGRGIKTAELDIAVKNRNTSSEIISEKDADTLVFAITEFIQNKKERYENL